MPSIFTRIINREIPSYKIAEDEMFYSFLDVFPVAEGHTLVVPKVEVDNFFDLPDEILAKWFAFSKPVAKAIEQAFDCNRCGISVMGLEVPHAHMHLVPINSSDDLNFSKPKLSFLEDEMRTIQNKIAQYL